MKAIQTNIPGLLVIEPQVFGDERGFFFEGYNDLKLKEFGIHEVFNQDNFSLSRKGVLRGLHYQLNPHSQSKMVRVLRGRVWDVAVDIRKNSPTYLEWFGVELTSENKKIFYIPAGFAHGFYVLSDEAEFMYKCHKYWSKEHERSVNWNDPTFNIEWPIIDDEEPNLSVKDLNALTWEQAEYEVDFLI